MQEKVTWRESIVISRRVIKFTNKKKANNNQTLHIILNVIFAKPFKLPSMLYVQFSSNTKLVEESKNHNNEVFPEVALII